MTHKDTVSMKRDVQRPLIGNFKLKSVAAIILAGAVLGGCAKVHNIEVGSVPDDYRAKHPIIISEKEEVVDIPVASNDRTMNYGTTSIVRGFAAQYRESSSGSIQVMTPVGSRNTGAASHVANHIRKILVEEGIPRGRIQVTSYQAAAQNDAAPIRLSYSAIAASTGPCGRWPNDLVTNTTENKHYENFGCATQNNLAAQIANPSDLIAPRGMTPIDAQRRDKVIESYRDNGAGLDSSTGNITITVQ